MPGMVTQVVRGYKCFYTQLHSRNVAYVGPDDPSTSLRAGPCGRAMVACLLFSPNQIAGFCPAGRVRTPAPTWVAG